MKSVGASRNKKQRTNRSEIIKVQVYCTHEVSIVLVYLHLFRYYIFVFFWGGGDLLIPLAFYSQVDHIYVCVYWVIHYRGWFL